MTKVFKQDEKGDWWIDMDAIQIIPLAAPGEAQKIIERFFRKDMPIEPESDNQIQPNQSDSKPHLSPSDI